MHVKIVLVAWYSMMLSMMVPGYVQAHGLKRDRLHSLGHTIAHTPDNPALYVKRGRVYHDSEQWDEAINDYSKALQINPEFYDALYWQGRAFLQKGNYNQAKKVLLEYLMHKEFSPVGHRAVAKVYVHQGNYLIAADHYDLAIKYNQKPSPQIYLERARILFNIKPLPAERIKSGLSNGIQNLGEIVTFIDLLIGLSVKTKNYQEAEAWLEKLPETLKRSPQRRNQKAELKILQGRRDEARNLYHLNINYIAKLAPYKQNLPAFVSARNQAEQGLLQLN